MGFRLGISVSGSCGQHWVRGCVPPTPVTGSEQGGMTVLSTTAGPSVCRASAPLCALPEGTACVPMPFLRAVVKFYCRAENNRPVNAGLIPSLQEH